jgi:general secretion pathway protein G
MKNKLHKSLKSSAGFTLIEIMAVVLIIGLLIATVGKPIAQAIFGGTQVRIKSDIQSLEQTITMYKFQERQWPDSLDELLEVQESGEPYLKQTPLDPWGNEYEYEPPTDGSNFIISTLGADGQIGGEGEDTDVSNESLRERE